jgi:hypothetical protein
LFATNEGRNDEQKCCVLKNTLNHGQFLFTKDIQKGQLPVFTFDKRQQKSR